MKIDRITITDALKAHPLAPAVLAQLAGDDEPGADEIQNALDAAAHGADGGFNGFTYHADIIPWVRKNRRAIMSAISSLADDLGEKPVDMVRGFRCLEQWRLHDDHIGSVLYGDGSDAGDYADIIYSALAWFALEEVGRAIESL